MAGFGARGKRRSSILRNEAKTKVGKKWNEVEEQVERLNQCQIGEIEFLVGKGAREVGGYKKSFQ